MTTSDVDSILYFFTVDNCFDCFDETIVLFFIKAEFYISFDYKMNTRI